MAAGGGGGGQARSGGGGGQGGEGCPGSEDVAHAIIASSWGREGLGERSDDALKGWRSGCWGGSVHAGRGDCGLGPARERQGAEETSPRPQESLRQRQEEEAAGRGMCLCAWNRAPFLQRR